MHEHVIQYARGSGTPKTTYGTGCDQHPFLLSSSQNTHENDQQLCPFAGAVRFGPHMAVAHNRCVATLWRVRRGGRWLRCSRAASRIGPGAVLGERTIFACQQWQQRQLTRVVILAEAHRTCVVLAGTRLCVGVRARDISRKCTHHTHT